MSRTGLALSGVSFVIGGIGLYYQFKSKISVESDVPVKTDSSINVPFKIKNDSVLPIYDVIQEWTLKPLEMPGGGYISNITFAPHAPNLRIPKIGPGETVSVKPTPVVEGPPAAVNSDIVMTIRYRTAILPFHRFESFRFETRMGEDGNIHWYHKALSVP